MKKNNRTGQTAETTSARQKESLETSIPFWRNWEAISQYQKDISNNLKDAVFGDGSQKAFQFAPTNLWQSILPSSFSLVQFTKEMRGNPVVESKIVTEVAGYGSQLGTILDFLHVMEKHYPLDIKQMKDEGDVYKVLKFKELVRQVNKAKGSA